MSAVVVKGVYSTSNTRVSRLGQLLSRGGNDFHPTYGVVLIVNSIRLSNTGILSRQQEST